MSPWTSPSWEAGSPGRPSRRSWPADGYDVLLLERQTSYRDKRPRGVPQLLGRGGDARTGPGEAARRRGRALHHPGRDVRRAGRAPRPPRRTRRRWTACSPASPAAWTSGTRRPARGWRVLRSRGGGDRGARRRRRRGGARRTADPALRARATWSRTGVRRPRGRRRRADVERAPPARAHPARHRAPHHGRRPARRRARRLAREPAVDGHRGRPLLPRLPPGARPRPPLPAARHRPARPVRRTGLAREVPRRVRGPLPARHRDVPRRPARPGRARSTR